MLHRRNDASNPVAFDAGHDEGYRVGFFERTSPKTMLPDGVPEQYSEVASRKSYLAGWQEVYFKGSRAREINR